MDETKKPNNPIAFPTLIYNQTTGEPNGHEKGMTLRDYFANSAMSEVPLTISQRIASDSDYDEWAKKCYKRADAMLKQRELNDENK